MRKYLLVAISVFLGLAFTAVAKVTLDPPTYNFGSVTIGGSSTQHDFTLRQIGGSSGGTVGVDAPFQCVGGCSGSLSDGDSRTITISFNPTSAGFFSSDISVGSKVGSVSGTGCPTNAACLANPLSSNSFTDLFDKVIDFIYVLSLAVVTIVVIIAGILFVTGGGNPQRLIQARNILIFAVIGFFVILIAKGLPTLIRNILGI